MTAPGLKLEEFERIEREGVVLLNQERLLAHFRAMADALQKVRGVLTNDYSFEDHAGAVNLIDAAEVDDPERPFDNGPEMGRRPRHLTDPRPAPPVETCGCRVIPESEHVREHIRHVPPDLHARLAAAEEYASEAGERIAASLLRESKATARLAAIEKAARAVVKRVGCCGLYGPADSAREALDDLVDALEEK